MFRTESVVTSLDSLSVFFHRPSKGHQLTMVRGGQRTSAFRVPMITDHPIIALRIFLFGQ